jgi:hypothetical protein
VKKQRRNKRYPTLKEAFLLKENTRDSLINALAEALSILEDVRDYAHMLDNDFIDHNVKRMIQELEDMQNNQVEAKQNEKKAHRVFARRR